MIYQSSIDKQALRMSKCSLTSSYFTSEGYINKLYFYILKLLCFYVNRYCLIASLPQPSNIAKDILINNKIFLIILNPEYYNYINSSHLSD